MVASSKNLSKITAYNNISKISIKKNHVTPTLFIKYRDAVEMRKK